MKSKILALPYIIWVAIFIIVPIFLVALFAFTNTYGDFTLENIYAVSNYSGVFLRSIWLGFIATVICFLIGYPFALLISKLGIRSQSIVLMLLMLPMWMNFLLRTYAWMTILENNGLINKAIIFLGFKPFEMINTSGAVVLGMVYNFLPYMILPIFSVISKIDVRIIEAAEDLGANSSKVFFKVIAPLSTPGVISGVTMVFVPAVSTFIISKMLGGGGNLLIGDLIEMQFLGTAYNPNLGSAISLILMVLILICIGIMNQFDTEETSGGIMP